ncbi:hypothetical protein RYX36_012399 [Vicia faba]
MAAVVIDGMAKRKKDEDNDNDSLSSYNNTKKRRVVWSDDLHAKFVEAVNLLGLHDAVPKKIVGLMNVDGITSKHVASHLQKYRLDKKKAAHKVPSTLIRPTQSQNIHPSYKFPVNETSTLLLPNKMPLHQFPTEIYLPAALNMSGVAPSPPSSTFPIYHQTSTFPTNIHPSYSFPVNQTSTLLLPNKMPLHQSHPQVYSPSGLNMSGRSPTQFHNIIHPPPSTFPIYHQTSTLFQPLLNQSTSPPALATTFDFHNAGTFVGSASSKSTSISDYDDWYTIYMKTKPQFHPLPNNSLPVSDSNKTSQMSSLQTEPFIDVSDYNLEDDTNIDISDYNLCSENSPIDFSVEKTNYNTLEWGCLEEDLINVMKLPSLC